MTDVDCCSWLGYNEVVVKNILQKISKFRISHFIVFDFQCVLCFSLVVHIVGWICKNHIRRLAIHKRLNMLHVGSVSAKQTMLSEHIEVPWFRFWNYRKFWSFIFISKSIKWLNFKARNAKKIHVKIRPELYEVGVDNCH